MIADTDQTRSDLPLRSVLGFSIEMTMVTKQDDAIEIEIRNVWNENLHHEMSLISQAINYFPYVAMDTEFPGTVCKKVTTDTNPRRDDSTCYESLKTNVNMLNMIQLGLTLSDDQGNLPTFGTNKRQCVWQFNFREFNLRTDMYAPDSIELLRRSGIDFDRNSRVGIESKRFADLLMGSGVVLNEEIQWVTFHCGYDFGYLLRLLTGRNLPEKQSEFLYLVKMFFPRVFDIKHMIGFCYDLFGGLSSVAERLEVERVGISHQAGSDSLLTARVFRRMKETRFAGRSLDMYCGVFDEAAPVVVPPVAEPAAIIPEDMDLLTALELTLRKARAHGGVVRGLHESAKLIEKRVAQLCVLAEDCNQPDYVKLVKALCADHNINLLTVPSAKTLGEWAGLCKIDSEGNARKVVGCSCLVVKDYGEDTTALNIVKKHIESN
ncbi:unnamed protein product [Brassica rapa]|uniref:40S ribosomal protein S12 n=1 Tax=Brassica campestris TaxID=3711 RepID=A0A8D9D1R7_BRACM|nr:unnamed protein product [Brassica rapa]